MYKSRMGKNVTKISMNGLTTDYTQVEKGLVRWIQQRNYSVCSAERQNNRKYEKRDGHKG